MAEAKIMAERLVFMAASEQVNGSYRKFSGDQKKSLSNTIISLKEKKIIENIKNANIEGQKNAIKKLVCVSIICIFFIPLG